MTQIHHQIEKSPAAHHQDIDPAVTGRKLLDDASAGQWLQGSDPDLARKLQADGVLPDTQIFDPATVQRHLAADLQSDQAFGPAMKQLHDANTATQRTIDGGKAADQTIQNDFNLVTGAVHDLLHPNQHGTDPSADRIVLNKTMLQGVIKRGSPDAQLAARRLLNNWDANTDFTSASAPPTSPAATRNATDPFMTAETVAYGVQKHDQTRAPQEQDLLQAQANEQKMQQAQATLQATMRDEQRSLQVSANFLADGKLQKGEGYYQVGSRLINMDGKAHSEDERKLMTRILQEQVAAAHGGHLPKYLSTKDLALTQENADLLFSRMQQLANPNAQA